MEVKEFCVHSNSTIIESIKALDRSAKKIVLVIEDEKLLGVITDGDIRRWILQNGSLEDNVSRVMNSHPVYIYEGEERLAKNIFSKKRIDAIPVLDKESKVVNIIFLQDYLGEKKEKNNHLKDVPIVIMAGGKGTRLYPYTKVLPKPLIPIGDKTILEHIMGKFMYYGCQDFYITVNYKKNMIKAYLQEQNEEININYVEEEKFLGTGGSLFLLKNVIDKTFILSNCDILIEADYEDILRYHKKSGNKITMITSLKNYTIPYGVIKTANGGSIDAIVEKPEYNFQVNTGFYILEPEVLDSIPENEFFHITELINQYVEEGKKVGVYPITGNSWLDMGELKEMEVMINRLKADKE